MATNFVSTDKTPTHDEIAAQAYEIYLREGSVAGREMEHWLKAEEELRAKSGSNNGNGNGNRAIVEASSSATLKTILNDLPDRATAPSGSRATTKPRAPKR